MPRSPLIPASLPRPLPVSFSDSLPLPPPSLPSFLPASRPYLTVCLSHSLPLSLSNQFFACFLVACFSVTLPRCLVPHAVLLYPSKYLLVSSFLPSFQYVSLLFHSLKSRLLFHAHYFHSCVCVCDDDNLYCRLVYKRRKQTRQERSYHSHSLTQSGHVLTLTPLSLSPSLCIMFLFSFSSSFCQSFLTLLPPSFHSLFQSIFSFSLFLLLLAEFSSFPIPLVGIICTCK